MEYIIKMNKTLESIFDEPLTNPHLDQTLQRDKWFRGRILDLLNIYHDSRQYEADLIALSKQSGLKVYETRAYVSVYAKYYDKSKRDYISPLTLHIE